MRLDESVIKKPFWAISVEESLSALELMALADLYGKCIIYI